MPRCFARCRRSEAWCWSSGGRRPVSLRVAGVCPGGGRRRSGCRTGKGSGCQPGGGRWPGAGPPWPPPSPPAAPRPAPPLNPALRPVRRPVHDGSPGPPVCGLWPGLRASAGRGRRRRFRRRLARGAAALLPSGARRWCRHRPGSTASAPACAWPWQRRAGVAAGGRAGTRSSSPPSHLPRSQSPPPPQPHLCCAPPRRLPSACWTAYRHSPTAAGCRRDHGWRAAVQPRHLGCR